MGSLHNTGIRFNKKLSYESHIYRRNLSQIKFILRYIIATERIGDYSKF